jgi:HD-GYP domain-containing protein (c-di-GMP phosphodiesterase class II)
MDDHSTLTFNYLGAEHTQVLGAATVRIGRHEDNDIVIENPYISRYHAEIVAEGSRHIIRDLGSTSGTFANGERITQRRLRDGDLIRLGRGRGVELHFHSTNEQADPTSDDNLKPVRMISPEETRFLSADRWGQSRDLGETIERLRALYQFTSELLVAQSSVDLSDKIAAFMYRTLECDRCAVMLWNPERRALDVAAVRGSLKYGAPSRSIAELTYNDNVAVLSMDATADARFAGGDSIKLSSIRSVMCAPMGSKTRLWGVCYVDNTSGNRTFDDEAFDFLAAVARQAGIAMENLYLFDEQKRSLESFMRTLAASLDARDDTTAGHSARVGAIASGVAHEMGLSEVECRAVYYAGLLHDYGKIGIRDDVLLKPASLTPEEYEHVKEHPQHTYRLLSKMRFPEDLADIPLVAASHHERWDGSGYPRGLKGDQIPLGSRIVSVADAFDAITEERCYNEPMSPENGLAELVQRSGVYFDPDVIEAFTRYFEKLALRRGVRADEVITLKEMLVQDLKSGEPS